MSTRSRSRTELRAAAALAAQEFDGVLTLRRLVALGDDHRAIGREVRAELWRRHGRHTVAVHTGDLSDHARRWRAVWEVAENVAMLDGVSALHAAGLTGFTDPAVDVSVPRNARCPEPDGVRVHRVRRTPRERHGAGLPRTRVEVAAIRAAHWAVSDRRAALVLCLVVQQRLTTGDRLVEAAPGGSVYLDVRWAASRLVVEIDGAGHRWGLAVTDDNLRQNELVLATDRVLRFDVLALRLHEQEVMAQVRRGL